MPVDVGLLRAKIARLKPEDRVRFGLGDQVDSIKVGLKPRASAPSDKEAALSRLVDSGAINTAKRDSLLAGLKPDAESVKEAAANRLVESGQINPAQRDSLLAGLRRERPAEPFGKPPWYLSPQYRNTPEGKAALEKATKEGKSDRRSLVQAGAEFAKTISDVRRLMEGKVYPADSTGTAERDPNRSLTYADLKNALHGGDAKPLFQKNEPAAKNLQTKLQAYGDSSAIVSRAIEHFDPSNDFDELIGMFPVARQGLSEYATMLKNKVAEPQAAAAIKAKYGYDPEDLRKVYYVETGK